MRPVILLITAAATFAITARAAEPEGSSEERRIGAMVLEIQAALKAPGDAKSLETIALYGTDSRHYTMIRGWLVQLKSGAKSQKEAASDPALKAKHQRMEKFLEKAIRRIDLE